MRDLPFRHCAPPEDEDDLDDDDFPDEDEDDLEDDGEDDEEEEVWQVA